MSSDGEVGVLDMVDTISAGPKNDYIAKVDISKANGGYYSKEEPILSFLSQGIHPIMEFLPTEINFCDFGGGHGILASRIKQFCFDKGYYANALVVDANRNYLEKARECGLLTLRSNLEDCTVKGCDLITMRGVNHYNSLQTQKLIYKQVFNSLAVNGFFVSSICSGSFEACALKSNIVNLPALGRAYEKDQIHATSATEYMELLAEAGFQQIRLVSYAPTQYWHPDDIWERSNAYLMERAENENNLAAVSEIENRKSKFYRDATVLVKRFIKDYLGIDIPTSEKEIYSLIPDTEYPIIQARKL